MKKQLFITAFSVISLMGVAQFDAPWEKDAGLPTAKKQPKTFRESQDEFYNYWKNKDIREEEENKGGGQEGGYEIFKRWEEYWSTRLMEDGTVPSTAKYWEEYEKMKASFKTSRVADAATWKSIGPFSHTGSGTWSPGQGRVNVVAEDPNDSKTIYLGAPNGGLWRSKDDGATWQPLTDDLPRIGVGAIAIDPKNSKIIYLGMGDDEASDCPSIGVMKSINGGLTWNLTGLTFTATGGTNIKCTDVIVSPDNSSILWASTSNGLYKTTDAGATWSQTLAGNIKGMNLKPGNSSIMYTVTANKFYKSTDGGTTFTAITSGLPTTAGRFSIDVTPADPERVYLLASATGNGFQGVYKSTDGGTSFTAVNTSTDVFENTQSWYSMPIGVSATDADMVFTGCLNVWKSSNGGTAFTRVNNWSTVNTTYTHADIHYIRYFKGRMYVGSDGGIYRSANNGTSFTDLTNGVAISQMYRISGSPSNKNILVAGLQDNGGYGWNGTNWNNYYGADGMDCAVDAVTPTTMYGFIQSGSTLYRSTNSGQSGSQYVTGKTGNWVTPLVADKDGSLLAGYSDVWRLKGTTWTQISTFNFGGMLNGLEISPVNSSIIYAFIGKKLYRTTNGGTAFTDITGTINGTITSVEAHYSDANKLWVTIGGWVSGSKVFYSSDGGSTWTNVSGNLPNFPANIVKMEVGNPKDAIYIGLDVGIYYTDNTMNNTWMPFMKDLPNSSVRDLEINEKSNLIRAGTFGRGIWESATYSIATGITTASTSQEISIYPNPNPGIFTVKLNGAISNEEVEIEVFNQLGEKVYAKQTKVENNELQVTISSLPSGAYILNFKAKDGAWHAKILKE
jgi:hypothetical protein